MNERPAVLTCALSEYQALVADLPLPTEEQIESFVSYVCQDHSWYKHLPFAFPGAWFTFFLNPLAGMPVRKDRDGKFGAEAVPQHEGFISWTGTDGRRKEFGFLDYCTVACGAQTWWLWDLHGQSGSPIPIISTVGRKPTTIPLQVFEVGSCELTAVIHCRTAWPYNGESWRRLKERTGWTWPEETGGPSIVDEIIRICDIEGVAADWIRAVPNKRPAFQTWRERLDWVYGVHPQMKRLLSLERDRQYRTMGEAIRAMLRLVIPTYARR